MLDTLKKYCYTFSVVAFVCGIAFGGLFVYVLIPQTTDQPPLRQSDFNVDTAHPHIDPILMSVDKDSADQFSSLKQGVQGIIDSYAAKGVTTTSVYFRDFNTLRRFEINRTERYSPASLMKVPMMMAYLKLADENPEILRKRLAYTGIPDMNASESVRSPVQLEPHHSYTIAELIEHMIRYSDNNAATLLYEYSKQDKRVNLDNMLKDLGIKDADAGADYMTVHAYARYFRVLYNSTYLDRDHSEYALKELLKTGYQEGMRSVIPKDVEVAEKFGEYLLLDPVSGEQMKRELGDCGIVYYPKHPYLLCVMTKGSDLPTLQKIVAEINTKVYEFVDYK